MIDLPYVNEFCTKYAKTNYVNFFNNLKQSNNEN